VEGGIKIVEHLDRMSRFMMEISVKQQMRRILKLQDADKVSLFGMPQFVA
jgi:hypothetical protein